MPLSRFWSGVHTTAVPSRVYGTSLSARCSALLSMEDFSFSESSIMATIFSNLVEPETAFTRIVKFSFLNHGPGIDGLSLHPAAQAWPRL